MGCTDDLFLYEAVTEQGRMFGLTLDQPPPVDHHYGPDVIRFGRYMVDAAHTGHCPAGSVWRLARRIPQTGSCLSATRSSPDPSDGPIFRGDLNILLRSIRTVLFRFPDDTPVHSGHGPATTIGVERRSNPFLT